MKFFPETDEWEMESGKRFYAFSGILGLRPGEDCIFYGHDGGLWETDLTPEELTEVARFMIKSWTEYLEEQERKAK